jgi:hypothetical protein
MTSAARLTGAWQTEQRRLAMPDQPTERDPAAMTEWTVLDLLLDQPRPWSLEELRRELDDRIEAVDAVANRPSPAWIAGRQ